MKARSGARGYEDRAANAPVSSARMAHRRGTPVSPTLAAMRGRGVRHMDIPTTFLKCDDINRQVPLAPPAEACVRQGHPWRARRAIYDLADGPTALYQTLDDFFART